MVFLAAGSTAVAGRKTLAISPYTAHFVGGAVTGEAGIQMPPSQDSLVTTHFTVPRNYRKNSPFTVVPSE